MAKRKKKTIEEYPYGICMVSVAPIRRKPDDRSEIVSQMLFGEQVEILQKKGKNWLAIRCMWDDYQGWIDPKQIIRLTKKDHKLLSENEQYALEVQNAILSDNRSQSILLGSTLPNFDGISFSLFKRKFVYYGQVIDPQQTEITTDIFLKIIKKYLYAPYLWGGRSPFGIDCSGYTQVVFQMCGYALPRDAAQQIEHGKTVAFVEESRLGDLAFFENKSGDIIHVGIVLEDQKIIHASGQVRIDKLDHFGIFNKEIKKYSHKLRVVKRILELKQIKKEESLPV